MNPAMPAAARADGKLMPNTESDLPAAFGGADGSGKWASAISLPLDCCRVSHCQISTVVPTMAFKVAASTTVFDWPSQRIRNSPAQKHAAAEPRVLAAYRAPTEVPTLRERRTVWETRTG